MSELKYFGSTGSAGGGIKTESKYRLGKLAKIIRSLASLWRNRGRVINVRRGMIENILVSTVMYESELQTLNAREKKKVEVFDINGLRKGLRAVEIQIISKWDIRERCGNIASLLKRVDLSTLRWLVHMERMDEGKERRG